MIVCGVCVYLCVYAGSAEFVSDDEMFVVAMQRQEFSIRGSLKDSVSRAIHLVSVYLPLFTAFTFVLPALESVLLYFESCKSEFAKGGAESRAREDALSFSGIPESILNESADRLHQEFDGHLPDMIRAAHEQSSQDRFNAVRAAMCLRMILSLIL